MQADVYISLGLRSSYDANINVNITSLVTTATVSFTTFSLFPLTLVLHNGSSATFFQGLSKDTILAETRMHLDLVGPCIVHSTRDGRYPKNSFGRLVGRLVEPLFEVQLVVQLV